MIKDSYVINNNTVAILPYMKGKSKVYENFQEIIINKTPNKIINLNCEYCGSSVVARRKFSEVLTGNNYKLPLLLNNKENVVMFPTESPRLKSCCWFNHKNIRNFYEHEGLVSIKMYDGKTIDIDTTMNIIRNQILKSTFLSSKIDEN